MGHLCYLRRRKTEYPDYVLTTWPWTKLGSKQVPYSDHNRFVWPIKQSSILYEDRPPVRLLWSSNSARGWTKNYLHNKIWGLQVSRNALRFDKRSCNLLHHVYLDQLVVVYLDDIMVSSPSLKEHQVHLQLVLKLRKNQLYVKKEKCAFTQKCINFLSHVIKHEKSGMDEDKLRAIQEWRASPWFVRLLHKSVGLDLGREPDFVLIAVLEIFQHFAETFPPLFVLTDGNMNK